MRYEDLAQDGALKVGGMPHAIGMVCFRELWQDHKTNLQTRPRGIIPILSRMVLQATGGPLSIRNAVEVDGQFQLAHTRDPQGQVNRVLLHMSADLFGPRAHTHDPQPKNAGERVHVGRVFAEHVFTRPWGKLEDRKVLALPLAEGDVVPPEQAPFRDALDTLVLPPSARALDESFVLDEAPLVFGLSHTDANQHVNSLVYPQLFEDAALRRMLALGHQTNDLLVEHMDIAFRKPCFAGQRVRIWQRAFELQNTFGTVAYLAPEGCPPERAACMCLLTFRRGELTR
jgi:hypothetical protein